VHFLALKTSDSILARPSYENDEEEPDLDLKVITFAKFDKVGLAFAFRFLFCSVLAGCAAEDFFFFSVLSCLVFAVGISSCLLGHPASAEAARQGLSQSRTGDFQTEQTHRVRTILYFLS
jgi:hypothetical protein